MASRIREVMDAAGVTIDTFAALLGEKSQRVKDVLRGKQRPPADMLVALAAMDGVDVQYVLTGFRSGDVPGARSAVVPVNAAAPIVDNLLRAHALPDRPKLRAALLAVVAHEDERHGPSALVAAAAQDLIENSSAHAPAPESSLLRYYRSADDRAKESILTTAAALSANRGARMSIQHVSADRGGVAGGRDVTVGEQPRGNRKK